MRTRTRQFGFTLTEMTLVVATIALLLGLGLPAVRMLLNSFESESGTRSMINAALSNARAIAARDQRYAGVRFQQDSDGNQYMIFIVHDFEKTGLSPGFRAVYNMKPIKLPGNSGIMDLMVRTNRGTGSTDAASPLDEPLLPAHLDDTTYIRDASTFSIVFSPSGKLVVRTVRVRNKDGVYQPDNGVSGKVSTDSIFNSPINITNQGVGLFVQDDYADLGLGAESSRNRFVIYDKSYFDKLDLQQRFNYLDDLELIYINPYTGTMIKPD
ncbi:Tfp pilus assembly protein FimT/FimU [Planctomycetota bacterium]